MSTAENRAGVRRAKPNSARETHRDTNGMPRVTRPLASLLGTAQGCFCLSVCSVHCQFNSQKVLHTNSKAREPRASPAGRTSSTDSAGWMLASPGLHGLPPTHPSRNHSPSLTPRRAGTAATETRAGIKNRNLTRFGVGPTCRGRSPAPPLTSITLNRKGLLSASSGREEELRLPATIRPIRSRDISNPRFPATGCLQQPRPAPLFLL